MTFERLKKRGHITEEEYELLNKLTGQKAIIEFDEPFTDEQLATFKELLDEYMSNVAGKNIIIDKDKLAPSGKPDVVVEQEEDRETLQETLDELVKEGLIEEVDDIVEIDPETLEPID
jgi:hypothetical protein